MVFRINESLSSNRAGPSNLCKLELASKNLQHPATVHPKGVVNSWTIHEPFMTMMNPSCVFFFVGPAASSFIGVLDIFGFEHFKVSPRVTAWVGAYPILVMTHSSPWYRWPIYIQLYSYCIHYIISPLFNYPLVMSNIAMA